jgi:hypothetical protein
VLVDEPVFGAAVPDAGAVVVTVLVTGATAVVMVEVKVLPAELVPVKKTTVAFTVGVTTAPDPLAVPVADPDPPAAPPAAPPEPAPGLKEPMAAVRLLISVE